MIVDPVYDLTAEVVLSLFQARQMAVAIQRCNESDPAAILATRVLQLIEEVNEKLLQIARLTASVS